MVIFTIITLTAIIAENLYRENRLRSNQAYYRLHVYYNIVRNYIANPVRELKGLDIREYEYLEELENETKFRLVHDNYAFVYKIMKKVHSDVDKKVISSQKVVLQGILNAKLQHNEDHFGEKAKYRDVFRLKVVDLIDCQSHYKLVIMHIDNDDKYIYSKQPKQTTEAKTDTNNKDF